MSNHDCADCNYCYQLSTPTAVQNCLNACVCPAPPPPPPSPCSTNTNDIAAQCHFDACYIRGHDDLMALGWPKEPSYDAIATAVAKTACDQGKGKATVGDLASRFWKGTWNQQLNGWGWNNPSKLPKNKQDCISDEAFVEFGEQLPDFHTIMVNLNRMYSECLRCPAVYQDPTRCEPAPTPIVFCNGQWINGKCYNRPVIPITPCRLVNGKWDCGPVPSPPGPPSPYPVVSCNAPNVLYNGVCYQPNNNGTWTKPDNLIPPYIPTPPKPPSEWLIEWDDFVAWLSEYAQTPEGLAFAAGIGIGSSYYTGSNLRGAELFLLVASAPELWYLYRIYMQYFRNVFNYYDLKEYEWPVVVFATGLAGTSAVVFGENRLGIPSFIENDTFITGLAVTGIATGITWFAQTEIGKGLGWIIGGLSSIFDI